MRQHQPPDHSASIRGAANAFISVASGNLPDTARDLIGLLGLPAAWRLIAEYGGQSFQVPKGKRTKGRALIDEIAEVIGAEAAQKLSLNYGGENLYIPSCKRAMLAIRDADLQARFDAMTSEGGLGARQAVRQLAREFGISDGSIWRALKRVA